MVRKKYQTKLSNRRQWEKHWFATTKSASLSRPPSSDKILIHFLPPDVKKSVNNNNNNNNNNKTETSILSISTK